MVSELKKREITQKLLNHNVLIVWRPEYELKIPIIDEQHRGIVSTINSLYFGMQSKHAKDMLQPVINMIYDYTRVHFAVEEDFLSRCGYPELHQHHELHNELTQELTRIGKKSALDQDPLEFLKFLKTWWINHICDKDRVFKEYLIKV